jgi:nucleoside-diphosphate-sugar epimerase
MFTKTTRSLSARAFKKQKSYPGLSEIIHAFYASIRMGGAPPISYPSILETVGICEEAYRKLKVAEAEEGARAGAILKGFESSIPPIDATRPGVLVTGGTGILGKVVASEIRGQNLRTRVVSRRVPPPANRIPGVEYTAVDLGGTIPPEIFDGVSLVVHCAAETAGGKEAHLRNSIAATQNLLEAMARARVTRFLHISSIAVLQSSQQTGRPVDENTPLVPDSESRGPYVWGKAESERLARELGGKLGIGVRVVRPGPLVDYEAFDPPGRLGKEVGRIFVYVGSKRSRLSICDVRTAAKVIRAYAVGFDSMPAVLNLVEPKAPTRGELVSHLLKGRPDLRAVGMPFILLRVLSPPVKLLQSLLFPGRKPVDIYSIFTSETYDTTLAEDLIRRNCCPEERGAN